MTNETVTKEPQNIFYTNVNDLEEAMKQKHLYADYALLDETWKKRFDDYMTGKKTMPLTYDPFFKCMFHPDRHPDWLSHLLSAIIGEPVTVESVLPSENTAISIDSLLIMDIVVRLSDGSLANVEIQKIPYMFTAERISCYSSDLLMREYSRLKKDKNFKYSDMKKVYTIVLYEKTEGDFKDPMLQGAYIHHGKTRFDTSLKLNLLQEYFLIALDVFDQNGYTDDKDSDALETELIATHNNIPETGFAANDLSMDSLEGWLSILTAETMADVERVIRRYPWSEPIFREMSAYVNNPEEVILMFSEALKIADRNTVKYMIEELQDKATHEAELRKQTEENLQQETQRRKQTEENLQQETQRRKQAEENQKLAEKNQKQETELRKQKEAELQLSRENEQKLQEKIAELESLLAGKN
ncbi:MAG: PD-(D/E)XK nuclease family transposase [Lachnospiraceae bacterium]|nr:PD-(D/E)XK nuclease family transposase [Lachnospiraceae bacterium]